MIAQQLFEAEEAEYEEDEATRSEIQSVRNEYAAGEYSTLDEYLASRANPQHELHPHYCQIRTKAN
jgi:hypothetical protein